MKQGNFLIVMGLLAVLSACSGDKPSQEQPSSQTQQPAQSQPNTQQTPATPRAASDPYQLPKNGKVIKAMHAGGYTYMQMEKDGKEFWIAATMMNVKRDDYVRWADAAVMKNFSSSTLHKTFDEILFVTNAELDQ
ncbi:MAG: hypothetical protein PVF82_18395 [Gammaproteobacteria bacterium]|jgi:hypothetical protein